MFRIVSVAATGLDAMTKVSANKANRPRVLVTVMGLPSVRVAAFVA